MTGAEKNLAFEILLEYVKRSRGFDFTGYKRSSLMRRVNKRMQMVGIDDYSTYVDYLEVHPDEFEHLFNTLLINVTSFFRDHSIWEYAISEIIPLMVSRTAPDEPIRVWTAGCASGEEAYTVAMAIAEVIGIEAFRSRVKIYATDMDTDALSHARQATYLANDLSTVPPELVEKYFELSNNRYGFRKDLRRSVIFGHHDLIRDAPICKIDLLLCRNVLMYFNAQTQARILSRFHFALRDGGFLFLGKAEMLLMHANTFSPVDLKRRIFTKVRKMHLRDRLLLMAQTSREDAETVSSLSNQVRLHQAAFEIGPVAGIVVDSNGIVVLINERARSLFNLSTRDVGRPLQDLEVSYCPTKLQPCIEQVSLDRRSITVRNVEYGLLSGEPVYLDVQVSPLLDSDSNTLGISVSFIEVTRYKQLQDELEHFNQELEMAYEELQATNEELETTNEELQSSNEELETTNEELQSTNEELETMNEELQSTNEELQTVNDELQRRSEELNQSNAFLESVFTSLRGGVVVLDSNLQVQIWNHKAEDLWGLRTEEVMAQNFLNLDIGLPVRQLQQPIRDCLIGGPNGAVEVTLDAVNRRGRGIRCRVTCTPLVGSNLNVQGVILLMENLST